MWGALWGNPTKPDFQEVRWEQADWAVGPSLGPHLPYRAVVKAGERLPPPVPQFPYPQGPPESLVQTRYKIQDFLNPE